MIGGERHGVAVLPQGLAASFELSLITGLHGRDSIEKQTHDLVALESALADQRKYLNGQIGVEKHRLEHLIAIDRYQFCRAIDDAYVGGMNPIAEEAHLSKNLLRFNNGEGVGFVVALPQLNSNGSFHEQEDALSDRSLLHQELAFFCDVLAGGEVVSVGSQ